MLSQFSWSALSKISVFFKSIHHLPPLSWDPVKRLFVIHPNPSRLFWFLSLSNLALTWCGIPIYTALSRIYGFGPAIPAEQVIFFVLEFFTGAQNIGLFMAAYKYGPSFCHSINEVVGLEKLLKSKSPLTSNFN